MKARRVLSALAAACLAFGCGSHAPQRAALYLPPRPAPSDPATVAVTDPVVESPLRPLELHPAAKRYVVMPERSRLEIFGGDVVTGEHSFRVERWRAYVDTEPGLSFTFDADLTSIRADLPFVTGIAKNTLLEVEKYPRARFAARVWKTDGPPDEHIVDGVAEVHGVQRGVRFTGTIHGEGDGYRFQADFAMSRLAFDIRGGAPLESFLRNDVRIVVDALATPERAIVEEL